MTNTRIVFFSIIVAILLAILVLWCADVLAHGQCVRLEKEVFGSGICVEKNYVESMNIPFKRSDYVSCPSSEIDNLPI